MLCCSSGKAAKNKPQAVAHQATDLQLEPFAPQEGERPAIIGLAPKAAAASRADLARAPGSSSATGATAARTGLAGLRGTAAAARGRALHGETATGDNTSGCKSYLHAVFVWRAVPESVRLIRRWAAAGGHPVAESA